MNQNIKNKLNNLGLSSESDPVRIFAELTLRFMRSTNDVMDKHDKTLEYHQQQLDYIKKTFVDKVTI
jgi:hypothetical protein